MFLSIGIATALRHRAQLQVELQNSSKYPTVLLCTNPSSGGNQGGTYLDMGAANGLIQKKEIHDVHKNVYVAPMLLVEGKDDSSKNSKQEKACGDKAKELSNGSGKLLVIAAGGDGTVQWVIDEVSNKVDETTVKDRVVFGILPLGTGNDGSQGLGWGQTSQPSELPSYLNSWLNSSEEIGIWSRTLEVDIDGALLEPIPKGHRVTAVRPAQLQINKSFKGDKRPKMDKINKQPKENWEAQTENLGPWKPTCDGCNDQEKQETKIVDTKKLHLTKNFLWYASVGQLEKAGYKFQYNRLENGLLRGAGERFFGGQNYNNLIYGAKGATSLIGNTAVDAIKEVTLNTEITHPTKIKTFGTSVVFLAGRTFAGGMALHKTGETQRSLDNTLLDVRSVGVRDMMKKKPAVKAGPAAELEFPSLEAASLGTANAGAKITFKSNKEPVYMQVDGEFVAMLNPSEMTIKKNKKITFLARK